MHIIGLTGGIAMGKSTIAQMLLSLHIPVINADQIVHALLEKNGKAVSRVSDAFAGVEHNGAIDRTLLGKKVFNNPEERKKLEAILHPMVREKEREQLAYYARKAANMVILEIPLLFETGAQRRCDYVMLASAPQHVQELRALSRKGMTKEKFEQIKKAQMPEAKKRRLADAIIPTGQGMAVTRRAVMAALEDALSKDARLWSAGYR